MLSSPRSLYEYYRQVDVRGEEVQPGMDVRSLYQSSACGVVLRMRENICTLPAMLHLMEMKESPPGSVLYKTCMAGW